MRPTASPSPRATGWPKHLLWVIPLVCFVLFGAAWLVRSPAPQPTTEGDKWFWQQAEAVPSLQVIFCDAGQSIVKQVGVPYHTSVFHMDEGLILEITERQGIEQVLHAMEGTPAFSAGKAPFHSIEEFNAATVAQIFLGHGEILCVTQEPRGSYVYLGKSHQYAPLTAAAAARLTAVLGDLLDKGRDQEEGYKMHLLTASQEKRIDADLRASASSLSAP